MPKALGGFPEEKTGIEPTNGALEEHVEESKKGTIEGNAIHEEPKLGDKATSDCVSSYRHLDTKAGDKSKSNTYDGDNIP